MAGAYTYRLVSRTLNMGVRVEVSNHTKKDFPSWVIAPTTSLELKEGHLLSCCFGRKKQLPMSFGQSELGLC